MKIKLDFPKIRFGYIPNGEVVTVHFRIKTSKIDWAIYERI